MIDLIPLRNRRPDPDTGDMLVTRISEGMTEWTLEDGRKGYGLSEYLDQIIDGAPVGSRLADAAGDQVADGSATRAGYARSAWPVTPGGPIVPGRCLEAVPSRA